MDPATFAAQAQLILQRHGGDQSPLLPLLQKWNVTQPVNQLQPGQYAGFLAEMRAAYNEAV